MIKAAVLAFAFCLLPLNPAAAEDISPQDFAKYFKIDLEKPLPSFEELNAKYAKPSVMYDYKYDYGWNIEEIFDTAFRLTIAENGTREKRLPERNEEALLSMLNNIPKEVYPYIGPYLHTVPGISDKILNLPGIKETKNKFPSRIAPQLKGIPDLEFLSPNLYFILMPEAWPQNLQMTEMPNLFPSYPQVKFDADFYEKIKKLVPPESYMGGVKKPNKVTRSDFRTVHPTPASLLTSADVKAFADTLDGVLEFSKRGNNVLDTFRAGALLDQYEQAEGINLQLNQMKDLVHPCQRLVQKIRILGPAKEKEFTMLVAGKGFTLNEWAYTCDKTIKAYRVSRLSRKTLNELKAYEKGLYNHVVRVYDRRNQIFQFSTMQGFLEMYKAPMSDVLEVKKNRSLLREKFMKLDNMLLSSPIAGRS